MMTMERELFELNFRIESLEALRHSIRHKELSRPEQGRIASQLAYMQQYSDVLRRRITYAKD
jgi:hypothetical protein